MAKYEAHITCPREQSEKLKIFCIDGWKYSAFDADPIMGDKPFAYLTAYDADSGLLLMRMNYLTKLLRQVGITILREKIERIIYDTKTGVDEINQKG